MQIVNTEYYIEYSLFSERDIYKHLSINVRLVFILLMFHGKIHWRIKLIIF